MIWLSDAVLGCRIKRLSRFTRWNQLTELRLNPSSPLSVPEEGGLLRLQRPPVLKG